MLAKYVRTIPIRALAQPFTHHAFFSVSTTKYKKSISKPVRTIKGQVVSSVNFLSKESFPPKVFLHAAILSGALKISSDDALNILEKYVTLAKTSKRDWEKEVLLDTSADPGVLAFLGFVTRRTPGNGQAKLADHILKTASKLGNVSATISLISGALKKGTLNDPLLIGPLTDLKRVAEIGKNAEAMVFQGKILENKRQTELALKWYLRASEIDFNTPETNENMAGVSEALVCLGKIYLQRKELGKAQIAFAKAALELDNATAYYFLGRLKDAGSTDQEVYLLKAAVSGILDACVDLGEMYLERAKANENNQNLLNATEWFEVAASAGFGNAMLALAKLCKTLGRPEEAQKWLTKAETANNTDNSLTLPIRIGNEIE